MYWQLRLIWNLLSLSIYLKTSPSSVYCFLYRRSFGKLRVPNVVILFNLGRYYVLYSECLECLNYVVPSVCAQMY